MLMLQRNLMNSTVLPTPIVSQCAPQAPAEARKRCVRAARGFTGQSDGPWVGGYRWQRRSIRLVSDPLLAMVGWGDGWP